MKKRLQAVLGAALALTMTGQAFALGTASYSSELISTRSLGQGGTGVAGVHNDPIVGYTNPAGLTALEGTQAAIDLTYVNGSPKFTSGVTAPGLGSNYAKTTQDSVSGARATSAFVPDFAASTRFMDGKLAAGLAVVTPYGLETHWSGDSPMRYQATDARLRIVDLTPAAAYKVSDMLSVGAGVDYWRTVEGQLDKKINTAALNAGLGGAPSGADASARLNGTGDGWGYHLGVTFKPSEHHQIGLVYHSSVKMKLKGDSEIVGLSGNSAAVFGRDFTTNVTAPLYMPQNFQAGWAWMPDAKTQVEVDAAWYDWYSARQLGIVYDPGVLTPTQAAVLNGTNVTQFKPRKTINFGLGFNHQCSDRLQGRAGFYYQSSALPENFFDAAFIDLPRYAATVGAGWKVTDSLGADFAYNAIFFHGRSINQPGAGGSGYSGTFNNFANVLSASLTYRTAAHF